jgi:hypothetical protein
MKNTVLLISVWFIVTYFAHSQETDSILQLNTLKYLDIGIGAGLPDGSNALNAGLSLDINDAFALFLEYNLYLDNSTVRFHETSIKAGPYARFSKQSYLALTGGFSFLFNTRVGESFIHYYLPIQLRVNIGINSWLSLGVKGAYNFPLQDEAEDRGNVFLFAAYKFGE